MYKYLCTVHKTFIIAALHFQNFSSDEYCKNILIHEAFNFVSLKGKSPHISLKFMTSKYLC